ncbi:hypothetical protein K402DRAFT_456911 [Aulographum hederae CBS 113979]|uniref:Ima1 N-terminal domain-containing protein n=1 Tax=Aulographum hederae CBS 113979 TaxID=1176131 RepID=A0A6G1GQ49_9PEZI|nr:hypothetical protein K402DRAFT_456911 [Aulographum hederae CBS 113979]
MFGLGRKCFYCARRSKQNLPKHVRQWDCENCNATNFLDHNGDIRDPPAMEQPETPRLSSSFEHSHFARFSPEPQNVFCATCQKNQHFFQVSISEYLPSPDDSNYEEYERGYESFKEDLERRYPLVCSQCAPAVESRLIKANYMAKTDHLRRIMEKTRKHAGIPRRHLWSFRGVIITLGALGWWASIVTQLAWHIIGAIPVLERVETVYSKPAQLAWSCASHIFYNQSVEPACYTTANSIVARGLMLGVLTVWWNNKLGDKLNNPPIRMIGLQSLWLLQTVFLAIRHLAYWLLRHPEDWRFGNGPYRAAHFMSALIVALLASKCLRSIRLKYGPNIDWSTPPKPLLKKNANDPTDVELLSGLSMNGPRHSVRQPKFSRGFPIDALAPQPDRQPPRGAAWGADDLFAPTSSRILDEPPSPPLTTQEDSDDETESTVASPYQWNNADAMDWTPSRPVLPAWASQKRSRHDVAPVKSLKTTRSSGPLSQSVVHFWAVPKKELPKSQYEHVFKGTLPPAPRSLEHKLRNPGPPPNAFRAATNERQKEWMGQFVGPNAAAQAERKGKHNLELAGRKFFINSDKAETGLETLFDSAFTIGDREEEKGAGATRIGRTGRGMGTNADDTSTTEELKGAIIVAVLSSMFVVVGMAWLGEKMDAQSWRAKVTQWAYER